MTSVRPVALVTGASAGLGAAYARRLAQQGFDLILVARRLARLEAFAAELRALHGVEAYPLPADLTRDADLDAVQRRIAQEERLEFVLNNAGFGRTGRFYETPLEDLDAMHRLHVMATLRLSHAALRVMTARGKGALVNVSSVAAFVCRPGSVSYYCTKAWINAFTEGLYLDLRQARSPVRVQALCPGYTVTEFHDVMGFDRKRISAGWWTPADQVVDASLAGLRRNQLFVVPGWRYKVIVALLRLLPRPLLHAAGDVGDAWIRKAK